MRNAGTWRFQCAADPGSQTDCLHGFCIACCRHSPCHDHGFCPGTYKKRQHPAEPFHLWDPQYDHQHGSFRSVHHPHGLYHAPDQDVVGTRIGTTAALVPLVIFIAPYLTRLFENSLLDVDRGIIEAAQAMGASYFEIIWYFLLPEAKGSLILSITTGTIGLLGATAMAGAIGAGGVGDLALTYGYERMNTPLMFLTVVILIIFVQIIQTVGNHFAFKSRNHE